MNARNLFVPILSLAAIAVSSGVNAQPTANSALNPPLAAPSPFDIVKNRYVSIDPNNPGKAVQFKVTLTVSTPHPGLIDSSWLVQAPVAAGSTSPLLAAGECAAAPGPESSAAGIDWDAAGCQTLHITGCPIEPTSSYAIQAVSLGTSTAALQLQTALQPGGNRWWADIVGLFHGTTWAQPRQPGPPDRCGSRTRRHQPVRQFLRRAVGDSSISRSGVPLRPRGCEWQLSVGALIRSGASDSDFRLVG